MSIAKSIIDDLGNSTVLAGEMHLPVQTVSSWKENGTIPAWRRDGVMEAARRLGKALNGQQLAYLASRDRKPDIAA